MGKITDRVSLQDVAESLGVDVSTVSLALREDPRISQKTRDKVKTEALRMGYRTNPLVSAWLRQVRQPEIAQAGVGMAFLLGTGVNPNVAAELYYRILVDGARAEAKALGYLVTEICFGHGEESRLKKALAQLRYRGVRGVMIFDPEEALPASVVEDLETDFAVVVLLRCGWGQRFHRVGADVAANVGLALEQLRAMGCRRIAFPIHPSQAQRVRKEALATYLWQQSRWPEADRLPLPDTVVEHTPELFIRWMRKQRPDALLSVKYSLHQTLLSAGFRMPGDLIFAHMGTDGRPELAGVNNRGFEIGRAAIFKLAGLITGNRFGVPSIPLNTLVPGIWCAPVLDAAAGKAAAPAKAASASRAQPRAKANAPRAIRRTTKSS